MWRTYGTALFAENVDRLYELGNSFTKMLAEQSDFEVLLESPQSNIVCYRFRMDDWTEGKTEEMNMKIREKIVWEGDYFIVQTRVNDKFYLRSTLMNPFTEKRTLIHLLEKIREVYSALKNE